MTVGIVLHFHPGWAHRDGTVLDAIVTDAGSLDPGLLPEAAADLPLADHSTTTSRRTSTAASP